MLRACDPPRVRRIRQGNNKTMAVNLEDVFGVSSRPVLSYVRRDSVDDRFQEALKADKQIVVYGSSKQGKTALVQEYLPYDDNLVVRLTPKTQIHDIYASILRQSGVEIKESSTETKGRELGAGAKIGFKALLPLIGGAKGGWPTLSISTNKQRGCPILSHRLGKGGSRWSPHPRVGT